MIETPVPEAEVRRVKPIVLEGQNFAQILSEEASDNLPDNERTNHNRANLTAFKEVTNYGGVNLTRSVDSHLAYYARTRDTETETDRIQVLQKIADRMTEGTGISTRIVIMRKGIVPQGFVLPDGTIMISLSLINKLDTLDEVGGVLAHEIGHLINKTAERKFGVNIIDFGLSWVHGSCFSNSKN